MTFWSLLFYQFSENFHAYALGSLDGKSEDSVPDELRHTAERSANAKDDRIVREILETDVVEKDTGLGVDVGARISCGKKRASTVDSLSCRVL
jgi:hypothetical protein